MTNVSSDSRWRRPVSSSTTPRDTVGCGDACVGAWMASMLSRPDAPPTSHLRFSAACAAVVCAQQGAYAPTMDEVTALAGL
ncbi:hypothetical protein FVF58_36120 [Paraburkholderia panacisoli]|uniref:Carbohydrate kinase PfkB domain-containing protein n=1 Tax=Paraburkholderia panacisoli TaxID=2603818 RepID=A0A5B0GJL0_9BURK|nr:hypothetical protein FVF58_36120 [Paraburkholderia panacisoli]